MPPLPKSFTAPRGPVWKGPEVDGVTQSMISRFLVDRERFRVKVIEGWQAIEKFNPAIEYGQMWHAVEEAVAQGRDWKAALAAYVAGLAAKYHFDHDSIRHWRDMLLAQFPVYQDFWAQHPDTTAREPILEEQVFDVPYDLPSGRRVRLRGKWDDIQLIPHEGIYLADHKTKSQLDQQKIARQLTFDLQMMFYMVALRQDTGIEPLEELKGWDGKRLTTPIAGVLYNVVRRSAHKSPESMLKKISEDIADGRGGEWFGRWKVGVTDGDIKRFCDETLTPILEQLCVWYDVMIQKARGGLVHVNAMTLTRMMHWRHPFGVYNVMDEGGSTDLDEYLATGSTVGLERVESLFRELE